MSNPCQSGACQAAVPQALVQYSSLSPGNIFITFYVTQNVAINCAVTVPIVISAGNTPLASITLTPAAATICAGAYPCSGTSYPMALVTTGTMLGTTPGVFWMTIVAGVISIGSGNNYSTGTLATYTDSTQASLGLLHISTANAVAFGGSAQCLTQSTVVGQVAQAYTNACIASALPAGAAPVTISNPADGLLLFQLAQGSSTAPTNCPLSALLQFADKAGAIVGTLAFTAAAGASLTTVSWWAGSSLTLPTSATTHALATPIVLSSTAQPMYLAFQGTNATVGTGLNPNTVANQQATLTMPFQAQISSARYAGEPANGSAYYITGLVSSTRPSTWEEDLRKYWWVILLVVVALILVIILIAAGVHGSRHVPPVPTPAFVQTSTYPAPYL